MALSAPKPKLFVIRAQSINASFEVLIVRLDLQKNMDVVVNGNNIEIAAFVARGLEPLVVDVFS